MTTEECISKAFETIFECLDSINERKLTPGQRVLLRDFRWEVENVLVQWNDVKALLTE